MTNAMAFVLIFTAATGAASFVWLLWLHHDETTHCQRCGCGMIESSTGWQCPECRNIVETE